MMWVEVRVKNFQTALGFKILFQTLLGVRGHPQNQTGWSYDTWNDFYCTKRPVQANFSFLNSQKAILEDFQAEFEDFKDFWKIKFPKIGENKSFYASNCDQISFCGVVQVKSFPTKCVVWSETAPIDLKSLKSAEVAIFSFLYLLKAIFNENQAKIEDFCNFWK